MEDDIWNLLCHVGKYEGMYDYYTHYNIILPLLQTLSDEELNKLSHNVTIYPVLQTIYKLQQKYNISFTQDQFNFVCHVFRYVYQEPDGDWFVY